MIRFPGIGRRNPFDKESETALGCVSEMGNLSTELSR